MKDSETNYVRNQGWSSHQFFEMAQYLVPLLKEQGYTLQFGRTVIHVRWETELVGKLYVHYNGRTKDYATLTNNKGEELYTFHYQDSVRNVETILIEWLKKERMDGNWTSKKPTH